MSKKLDDMAYKLQSMQHKKITHSSFHLEKTTVKATKEKTAQLSDHLKMIAQKTTKEKKPLCCWHKMFNNTCNAHVS